MWSKWSHGKKEHEACPAPTLGDLVGSLLSGITREYQYTKRYKYNRHVIFTVLLNPYRIVVRDMWDGIEDSGGKHLTTLYFVEPRGLKKVWYAEGGGLIDVGFDLSDIFTRMITEEA